MTPAEQARVMGAAMYEATGNVIPNDAPLRRDLKPGTVFYFYWPKKDYLGQYDEESLVGQPYSVEHWADGAPLRPHDNDLSFWCSHKNTEYGDVKCKVLWIPPEKPTSKIEAEKAKDPKALAPKKPTIHHVPVALLIACAEALDEGAIKYGRAKWRETDTEMMTYLGGVLRHVYAYIEGEDIDPESITGKTHLAGAVASLAILLDCIAAGTIVDNRPTKIGAAKLLRAEKK